MTLTLYICNNLQFLWNKIPTSLLKITRNVKKISRKEEVKYSYILVLNIFGRVMGSRPPGSTPMYNYLN